MSVDDFMELIEHYGDMRVAAAKQKAAGGWDMAPDLGADAAKLAAHIRTNLEGLYESFNEPAADDTVIIVTDEEVRAARQLACDRVGMTWGEIEAQAKRGWFDTNQIHNTWMTFAGMVDG